MKQLKLLTLQILSIPLFNALLRLLIQPFKGLFPIEQLVRIPVVGQIPTQYDGLDEFVMVTDGKDSLASRIYWQGTTSFEASETNVYMALLQNAQTILDIGANTGLYSLIAGVHHPPKNIYCFEPMPVIADTLRRNINANHFDHVQVFEMAITDSDGEITLYVPIQGTLPMGSSTSGDFRNNTKPISVIAKTLDTLVSEEQINQVDLMKIDTESTESAVLRGGADLINRDRPLIMCEILTDTFAKSIAEFFDAKDYQIYRIEDDGIRHLEHIKTLPDATNFLFAPSEKLNLVPQHLIISDAEVTA